MALTLLRFSFFIFYFFVEKDRKTKKVCTKVLFAILCVEAGLHGSVIVCFGFACI